MKRFIGHTTEEEGVERKDLTHLELMDTQDAVWGSKGASPCPFGSQNGNQPFFEATHFIWV